MHIQPSQNPAYRFCYFEAASSRYFADMTDLNHFIRVLIPLPTILHTQVKVYQCDDAWQFDEQQPIAQYNQLIFSDDTFLACLDSFIRSLNPGAEAQS